MEQHHLRLELKLSSPHSYDHSILHGNSAPPQPGIQIEERDSVAFYSEPRNQSQDDYPDGGLRSWLVVLGVRLPVFLPFWTESDHVLGCLYLFFNVSGLWHTACSYKVLIAARRGGYVCSWGVSRYYIVSCVLILSILFSPGLSGLLREPLTKRNLTFYYVRLNHFFYPFVFTLLNGYHCVALGSVPCK